MRLTHVWLRLNLLHETYQCVIAADPCYTTHCTARAVRLQPAPGQPFLAAATRLACTERP